MKTLWVHGRVVTMDGGRRIIEDGAVADGPVTDVGRGGRPVVGVAGVVAWFTVLPPGVRTPPIRPGRSAESQR
jgi:hypothetical protein